jgi:hypothetical protein
MSNPAPDDWQKLTAQHRQAEFNSKVAKISRSGRRGNRIFGGILMLFGAGALLFGLFIGYQYLTGRWQPAQERTRDGVPLTRERRDYEGVLWMVGGGVVTIGTGVLVWRGTLTKR